MTGACVGIPKKVFENVGGWSEGYIIGDFEDFDLCLKVAERELKVTTHHGIEFVHLEC